MASPGSFRRILSEEPPLDRSSACSSPQLSVSSSMSFSDITGGEEDYSPRSPKRQRLHRDDAFLPQSLRGSMRSSRDSPSSELSISNLLCDISVDDFGSCSFDDAAEDSVMGSPSGLSSFRKKYKKHELWASIRSDYHYLMDKEIIETCKSTESDLSWESDDLASNTNVSFAEFLQQYKELTDWLNHIEAATKVNVSSLSEKYLNQTYHEEMLERSPRKKLFNDYAKQLMRRYPAMKEEIQGRLQHLNARWATLQRSILPAHGYQDHQTMLTDLEHDLSCLRQWLHKVESEVVPLTIRADWTVDDLRQKLQQHEGLQRDIESHSKIVNAVLKLCERLRQDEGACSDSTDSDALRLLAVNLESRWHAIWLQSLEWRCRLEEAIAGGQRPINRERYGYSPEGDVLLEEDSFMDTIDDDDTVSSDPGNYDVIPFSDTEYERIVDTDDYTDKMSDCDNVTRSERNVSDLDSALGKSSSDPSVSDCHHGMAARLADRTVKTVTSSQEAGSTSQNALRLKRSPLKSDSRDIGYSSESHSNEEAETGVVTDDQKKHIRSCQNLETVLRRKDLGGSTGNLQPSARWRHSMTSAYDTSSTCSDLNLLADKVIGRTGSEEAVSDNVQSLINSPSHRFYCMTSIDTDSADSTTRWQNNSSVSAKSLARPASPVDKATRVRKRDIAKMKLVTHSMSAQLDADAGLSPITDDKSYGSMDYLNKSPIGVRRECVRRLIQQAELLIHDADLWHLQSSCRLLRETAKVVKQQQKQHHMKLNNSLTSTDGSLIVTTTEDSQLGSCDASSEGSDEEFSTASSNGKSSSLYDTTFFTTRSLSVSPAKSDIVVTRQKLSPKKRRHHLSESRTDLGPLSSSESAIDRLRQQYKRATPNHTPVSPKLRRTCSEASSPVKCHSSPHKCRHTRMKRSKSDELDRKQLTSTPQLDSSVVYSMEGYDVKSTRKCLMLDQAVPSHSPTQRLTSIASETDVFSPGASDVELARFETDDTDGVVPGGLLSTTQESFSEHAWDPYQAPPYTSVSDDFTEEKLDPGKLQADWEHTLEYEEEFPFDDSFGCSPMAPLDTTRGSGNKRSQNSWFSNSGYHGDINGDNSRVDYDSDSDVDEFHYVITESQKAMDFTESTLAIKPGKDAMNTGVYLNPSEYVDPLATCQTNIKCLQDVVDMLQIDEGLTNVPKDDIEMVQCVIDKWRHLEGVTTKRQDQSKQLSEMYKQLVAADACIVHSRDTLDVKTFGDIMQLEVAIKAILSSTTELVSQKCEMTSLQKRIRVFAARNTDVQMTKFAEDVTQILDDIGDNLKVSMLCVAQLQPQLTGWLEYNKAVKELTCSLNQERQRLQCLHLAVDVVSLSTQEMADTVSDLKVMQSEFSTYDNNMAALRELYTGVGSVCSHQMAMHAEVAVLSNQLAAMKCQCQEMIVAMETRLLVQRNKEAKAKIESAAHVKTKRNAGMARSAPSGRSWWSLLLYLLKWAVPIATLFVVVMCCLIDPHADTLGLSISPDLRYVRGPPPT